MSFGSASSFMLLAIAACVRPGSSITHEVATDTATILAPGVVSTAAPEFSITFEPSGKRLYFDRASADRSSFTIMTAELVGGQWRTPEVASFSGQYRDVDPFVTADGNRLYFSSDRPRAQGARGLHIWYIERTATGWTQPIDPGAPINSDSTDVFASQARDGTIVFGSLREGKRRVYLSTVRNGEWSTPRAVQFGSIVDDVSNPLIDPDGRFMLVVRDVPGRGSDIFISCRNADGWSDLRPLVPAVNSRYADFAPALDPDASSLYFTSERPGVVGAQPDSVRPPGDIYQISLRAAGVRCP